MDMLDEFFNYIGGHFGRTTAAFVAVAFVAGQIVKVM